MSGVKPPADKETYDGFCEWASIEHPEEKYPFTMNRINAYDVWQDACIYMRRKMEDMFCETHEELINVDNVMPLVSIALVLGLVVGFFFGMLF